MLKAERISILLGAIAGVAACAQVEVGAHAVKASAVADDPSGQRMAPVQVATDAEGYALWSGFRTSDGVWVAHPRLPAPSRAYVRNSLNGRVTEAKVLRRDPKTPGPMILLSAEAARELEIGPHRLTKVQIELIEDALPEAAVAEAPTAEVPEPAPTAEVSETALAAPAAETEPLAEIMEAPEIAAVAPASTPAASPQPQKLADVPAGGEAAPEPQVLAEIPVASASVAQPQVLAEMPAEPAPISRSAAPTAPSQPTPAPENAGVFRGDAPYELGGAVGGGDLALATPSTPTPPELTPASATAKILEPAVRSPAPAPPAGADNARPATQSFVQVVSFTAESSAAELATRLSALGHPTLTDSSQGGESRWSRVLIGPLANAEEERAALEAANSLGYADAYVTRRSVEAPSAPPPARAAAAKAPSAPATAPASAKGTEASPYIQVGSFSVKDNADAVVARLKSQGLPSFAASGDSKWHRVLIGPLDGSEQTARALDAAKSLGHSDAFVTRF